MFPFTTTFPPTYNSLPIETSPSMFRLPLNEPSVALIVFPISTFVAFTVLPTYKFV